MASDDDASGSLVRAQQKRSLALLVRGAGGPLMSGLRRALEDASWRVQTVRLIVDADALERAGQLRFDVGELARRLLEVLDAHIMEDRSGDVAIALIAGGTGAAAALVAAAERPRGVQAVVCLAGRPDLALPICGRVQARTMLIADGADLENVRANSDAYHALPGRRELWILPRASSETELTGVDDRSGIVAARAARWVCAQE